MEADNDRNAFSPRWRGQGARDVPTQLTPHGQHRSTGNRAVPTQCPGIRRHCRWRLTGIDLMGA